jgi:hypothetical protein
MVLPGSETRPACRLPVAAARLYCGALCMSVRLEIAHARGQLQQS